MSRLGPGEECQRCGYSHVKAGEHNDRMFARFGRYLNYMDELRPLSVCTQCRRVHCSECTRERASGKFCLSACFAPTRRGLVVARPVRDARQPRCRVCGLSNAEIAALNRQNPKHRMRKRRYQLCPGCGRWACNRCISWEGGLVRCRSCLHFALARLIDLHSAQERLFRDENNCPDGAG